MSFGRATPDPRVSPPPGGPVTWIIEAPEPLKVIAESAFDARLTAARLLKCEPDAVVLHREGQPPPQA